MGGPASPQTPNLPDLMARIKNRNSVPSIPVIWRSPKDIPIQWRTATEPFDSWVKRIWVFCDGNQIARPTEDDLDQLACTQLPSWACDGNRQALGNATVNTGRSGGCASCRGGYR